MPKKCINDILLDVREMIDKNLFNQREIDALMSPFLFHRLAFEPLKKHYLLNHYGSLIDSLHTYSNNEEKSSFLEIGCGTGSASLFLASKNDRLYSTGIDLNSTRIDIAKKRKKWHNIKNCMFLNENFLEFKADEKFDLVYSLAAFELIKPQEAALEKLNNLLGVDGIVILDMANPYFFNNSRNQLKHHDVQKIENFFHSNGYDVSKEYQSIVTGLIPLRLLKHNSSINTTIRIIAKKRKTIRD